MRRVRVSPPRRVRGGARPVSCSRSGRPRALTRLPRWATTPKARRLAGAILGAATNARWPMYLRNVKQILRAGGFDERAYGFSGLMDLLRACQREGTVRLERDRRGGLRVMQGPALVRGVTPAVEPAEAVVDSVDRHTGRSPVTGRRDRIRPRREHAGGGRGYDRGVAGTREAETAPDSCRPGPRIRPHLAVTRPRAEPDEAGSTASRRRRVAQEKRGQPAPQPFERQQPKRRRTRTPRLRPSRSDFRLQVYRLRPSRKSIHSLMSGMCEPRPFSYAAAYARASFTSSARV